MPISALTTDLYQLTMMAGYYQTGRHETPATFELFVRRLPRNRACLIAAGLEQALDYITALRFAAEEIDWIRALPVFSSIPRDFFEYLRTFRFTGDVSAMKEGTPFFPNEPIMRVTAPLAEAQLLETTLLAIINFQTAIASKAHRIVEAASGKPVFEFGARRAHGPEAALYAARAGYVAGVTGTSMVEAGRRFGIPLSGTMAHSWILAAASEREAFESYAALFGAHTVLLLDTFDVAAAAEMIVKAGLRPSGVRLDSGDMVALSKQVRSILDRGGLQKTGILVSGDLDEMTIRRMVSAGVPVDGFAVGTALSTSEDAPALGGVYKLVQVGQDDHARDVMKKSEGKSTWPGRKQVWRVVERGTALRDVVALEEEPAPRNAIPLLDCMMRGGQLVHPPPSLAGIRAHRAEMIAMLPEHVRQFRDGQAWTVEQSEALQRLMLATTAA